MFYVDTKLALLISAVLLVVAVAIWLVGGEEGM